MSDGFEYFDGRHICPEVRSDELHAVTIEELGTFYSASGEFREIKTRPEPLEKALYPRPVESLSEARALYLSDQITERQFEHYLDRLADDTQPYGGLGEIG